MTNDRFLFDYQQVKKSFVICHFCNVPIFQEICDLPGFKLTWHSNHWKNLNLVERD